MADVHCLGVLVVDALSGPISEYPVPGVVAQVNTKSIKFLAGGGAANTGSALGQMGIPVAVFSKVGGDINGLFLRAELERNGVDAAHVRETASESTPFTFVGIHPTGDRSFIHTPGCNLTFSIKDLDLEALFACKALLYQDMWVLPKLDGPSAPELLSKAQKRGVTTLLDECYGLGPNRDVFEAALPFCDVVLPSYDDLRRLYPQLDPAGVAAYLLQKGACRVVLKLGREGCLVASPKNVVKLPSVAMEIVDTTGAGDCFNAGFIAGLVNGLDDVEAAKVGAAAAAACMRNVGGAVGIPKYAVLTKTARATA
jgi:sugar/nucleoside kinase (ribokinase family)